MKCHRLYQKKQEAPILHIVTADIQLAGADLHVTGTHVFFIQKEQARFIPTIIMLPGNTIAVSFATGKISAFTNGTSLALDSIFYYYNTSSKAFQGRKGKTKQI